MTTRVRAGSARFVNVIVENPRTFPSTNVRPSTVPDGSAVRLNPRRPAGPRVRIAGRDARSPEDEETSNSPRRSPRTVYAPASSARTASVVPFVWSTTVTSAFGTACP